PGFASFNVTTLSFLGGFSLPFACAFGGGKLMPRPCSLSQNWNSESSEAISNTCLTNSLAPTRLTLPSFSFTRFWDTSRNESTEEETYSTAARSFDTIPHAD